MGELYANPAASQAMLDEAGFNVEAWLGDEIGREFARAESVAFVSGYGLNKPRGFLVAPTAAAAPDVVGYAQLKPVIEQRCAMCHGEALQSKGVRLDSPALLQQHAQTVYQQVVVSKLMPMNNATGLTDDERALFAQWFKGGAKVD